MTRPRIDLRLAFLLALTALVYGLFTQNAPYHVDTAGYVATARHAIAARALPPPLDSRFINAYWYIPFLWAFGDAGIKVSSLVLILGFAFFYYRLIWREFGDGAALAASLLMLSVPATLLTSTHLKEDFLGLLLLAAALCLLGRRPSPLRTAFAGALYGLACLSKELPLILLPFVLAHIGLACRRSGEGREPAGTLWRRWGAAAGLFTAAAAGTMFVISPRHFEYLRSIASTAESGQFLGLGSPVQATGIRAWQEGMLYLGPFHLLLLPLALWAIVRKAWTTLLWLGAALWTFAFISNTTVVMARLFDVTAFFATPLIASAAAGAAAFVLAPRRPKARMKGKPAPVASRGTDDARGRIGGALPAAVVPGLALVLAAFQVSYLRPTLEYRRLYPPQERFYGGLRVVLPADALLVGSDDCVLARYYAERECLSAPIEPDSARAEAFAGALAESVGTRPVYLLPGAFAYDRAGTLRRSLQVAFAPESVYAALGEDYHALTYGRRLEDLAREVERRVAPCRVGVIAREPFAAAVSLPLEHARLPLRCPDREDGLEFLACRGFQTFLMPMSVDRLRRLAGPPPRGGP